MSLKAILPGFSKIHPASKENIQIGLQKFSVVLLQKDENNNCILWAIQQIQYRLRNYQNFAHRIFNDDSNELIAIFLRVPGSRGHWPFFLREILTCHNYFRLISMSLQVLFTTSQQCYSATSQYIQPCQEKQQRIRSEEWSVTIYTVEDIFNIMHKYCSIKNWFLVINLWLLMGIRFSLLCTKIVIMSSPWMLGMWG